MCYVYTSHCNCIEDKFKKRSLSYSYYYKIKVKSTNMVKIKNLYSWLVKVKKTLIWQKVQNYK